jgi:gamma-glutamylcyclotransferase
MDWAQMSKRSPSCRFVGIAVLPNHRLAFTRKSIRRGCGVADAVREAGQAIWGAVYEISEPDVGELDKAEGYRPGRDKNSYWRQECVVLLNGAEQCPLNVFTYFGDPQPNPPLPNRAYKDVILSGARHWHLPDAYIQELARIEISA